MQKQNDLANNLLDLFKDTSYKKFNKGYFVGRPNLEGYYYIFKNITDPKFCLILNTTDSKYPSNMVKIKDYVFIVLNVPSLENYLENFVEVFFPTILNIIDQNLQKENTRNLPYGYYLDENGDLKIDLRKAAEVRKIYDMYIDTQSIRHIANELKTDFSHIRDILHDNEEYMQMQNKIVPLFKLKQVNEIMAGNIRGGAIKKKTVEDEIKEVRRARKNKEKLQELRN